MTLSIYIWEGNGISDAYHDDGTLVVLAESPDEAREIVRAQRTKFANKWDEYYREGVSHPEQRLDSDQVWDGREDALNREPDRILPIDKPAWVAFNGGGYD